MSSEQWQVICLEALAIPEEGWKPDGWRAPGDALWPERWTREKLEAKRVKDPHVWLTNYQQRPIISGQFWFNPADIHYYEKIDLMEMNVYLIVDPALRKDKKADPTVIGALGFGSDRNIYWLEVRRERVDPDERSRLIFGMHKKWHPIAVGYEEYGLQSDVSTLRSQMEREQYRFNVVELGRSGAWHMVSKEDRIRTLQGLGREGRLWLPHPDKYPAQAELVRYFVEREWSLYCGSKTTQYDDVLDMLSRVNDPGLAPVFPWKQEAREVDLHWGGGTSWLSA